MLKETNGKRSTHAIAVIGLAAIFGLAPIAKVTFSQSKESVPKTQNKNELAEPQVTQLLLLMDTDKNGKISKKEWMDFMSAEFDRLDKDKSGELDPKELAQSRLQATKVASVGK